MSSSFKDQIIICVPQKSMLNLNNLETFDLQRKQSAIASRDIDILA